MSGTLLNIISNAYLHYEQTNSPGCSGVRLVGGGNSAIVPDTSYSICIGYKTNLGRAASNFLDIELFLRRIIRNEKRQLPSIYDSYMSVCVCTLIIFILLCVYVAVLRDGCQRSPCE